MAKVLIAHFSQTGNTERVACAIRDAVAGAGHDCRLAEVRELRIGEILEYDLVFLGSACHSAGLAGPVSEILAGIPPGSRLMLAGFATHSSPLPEGGERNRQLHEAWAGGCRRSFQAASDDGRVELLGYFGCQGAPSPPIEEFIHSTIMPDDAEWQAYVEAARRHPDAADLEAAGAFGRDVAAAYMRRVSSSRRPQAV